MHCFLSLCLASLTLLESAAEPPTAPDGQRGLGAQPSDADLRELFGAREGPAAEWLAGLRALGPELELRLAELRTEYQERGWDVLLPPARRGEFELAELHDAFRQAAPSPEALLDRGDDRARALGEMLLDERFRARAAVLAGWEQHALDLRRGLAVLGATTEGFVVLSDEERAHLGPRLDLAAGFLRAFGNDLAVLAYPPPGGAPARVARGVIGVAARELLAASPEDRHARLATAELAAERMTSLLFSSRLAARPEVVRARARLDAALLRAEALRDSALEYLPDTPEGEAARPEIAALRKHERLRYAGAAGLAGLSFDPLDEICAFAAGSSEDFAWGPRRARAPYDRYLALRGIRSHDHRTLKGRKLTAWEQQALAGVTAGF